MPIEIKELHIRMTVNAPGNANEASSPTPVGNGKPSQSNPAADREALVAECVEQVLQILADKKER